MNPKLELKKGNRIIQTGNGIISSTSRPQIEKQYLPFLFRSQNPSLQTENGIFQTGNGIISPTSQAPIKKLLVQNASNFY